MYETKPETAGLRSGFRQAKPPRRVECVSASVLYEGQRSCEACKEKVPAHVGKRARAIVKTSRAMTMRF